MERVPDSTIGTGEHTNNLNDEVTAAALVAGQAALPGTVELAADADAYLMPVVQPIPARVATEGNQGIHDDTPRSTQV